MVTIKEYRLQESKDGKDFIALVLQGDVELVQSMETGRFYATARRCKISSTFDEETALSILGTKLPGRIERLDCEEYEYTLPESGEVIKLAHTYQYVPDDTPTEKTPSKVVVTETLQD